MHSASLIGELDEVESVEASADGEVVSVKGHVVMDGQRIAVAFDAEAVDDETMAALLVRATR